VDLAHLLVLDALVPLLGEVHLGSLHAVEIPLESADLVDGDVLQRG
jgi:hypothetical protein